MLYATRKTHVFRVLSKQSLRGFLEFFVSWVQVNGPRKEKNYTTIHYSYKLGKTGPVK